MLQTPKFYSSSIQCYGPEKTHVESKRCLIHKKYKYILKPVIFHLFRHVIHQTIRNLTRNLILSNPNTQHDTKLK